MASLVIAGVPALAAFAASGPAATAVTAAARPTGGTGHLTVTHGPPVRNGGVGLDLVKPGSKPGSKPLSENGGIARKSASTNWSGYAASGGTYRSVSASWVQPTGQCSGENGAYSSFWVGLDGYSSNSVEQTGTDTDCINGSAQYYGWYEIYPNPSNSFGDSISPGDTIRATVTYAGSNKYTLTLADSTNGWSTSTSKTLSGAPRSSAEVIIEAPSSNSGVLPLADFGTVNISDALVDGSPIGNDSPAEIAMVNTGGTSMDTISPLNDGANFSATWERSN